MGSDFVRLRSSHVVVRNRISGGGDGYENSGTDPMEIYVVPTRNHGVWVYEVRLRQIWREATLLCKKRMKEWR
jgi:hypothetical protein